VTTALAVALGAACSLAALAWIGVLFDPKRAWQLRPVAEDETPPPPPTSWPSVRVVVPAHNEAGVLPRTIAALIAQDYPGEWQIVLVDERSSDDSGAVAAREAEAHESADRLAVVRGSELPHGWIGKVWGLEQGLRAGRPEAPDYYLFTDADIAHQPQSLRTLVSESEDGNLALNSRMARLHCASLAERALIPAFVFFFNLLYPMRRVNDPTTSLAAAAGGCVLVNAATLRAAGGLERIRNEIIDDVNLARVIKGIDPRLRLAISREDVRSLRRYDSLRPIWRMVRRTAFDELGYSWRRLLGTVVGMLLLFLLPAAGLGVGAALAAADAVGAINSPNWQPLVIGVSSLTALIAMRVAYTPAIRLFELRGSWAWALPFAGTVYGLATLDSARMHLAGRSRRW
jgi:hopene-associated glycosyltransferase HpnB